MTSTFSASPTVQSPLIDVDAMCFELERDEGRRFLVYDDATGLPIGAGSYVIGHPTIGVGRCLDRSGLRDDEIDALLENDIVQYLDELVDFPWFMALDPCRRRAIVNMRHQLGLVGLLGFHRMIAALVDLDYDLAYLEGCLSLWYRQTPMRAKRVLELLRLGA